MFLIKNCSPFYLEMCTQTTMRTHATHSCFLSYLCYIFLFFCNWKQNKLLQPSALIEGFNTTSVGENHEFALSHAG